MKVYTCKQQCYRRGKNWSSYERHGDWESNCKSTCTVTFYGTENFGNIHEDKNNTNIFNQLNLWRIHCRPILTNSHLFFRNSFSDINRKINGMEKDVKRRWMDFYSSSSTRRHSTSKQSNFLSFLYVLSEHAHMYCIIMISAVINYTCTFQWSTNF